MSLCVYCSEPSNLRCNKCSDYYCSKECQLKDWPNHRFICFELPELIPILDKTSHSSEKIHDELEEPNSFIENGSDTVVQDSSEESFKETVTDKTTINESDGLEMGQQYSLIENGSDLKLQDTLIDTIPTTTEFEQMFDDEDELCNIFKQISVETQQNQKNEIIRYENDKHSLKQNTSELVEKESSIVLMLTDLKMHEWPKNKNIKVKLQHIVQSPNIISFVEDKKVIDDLYDFMCAEIQKYRPGARFCNGLPKTNEIVLGHFEGSYYRARVLDAAKSGIIVLFIDYGNMALLRTDEVFPISGEIDVAKFSFEICSLQFIVDNIPEVLDEKQEEILESKRMMITNVHADQNGIYHCEIFGF